jgi:HK97 family phage portal protein
MASLLGKAIRAAAPAASGRSPVPLGDSMRVQVMGGARNKDEQCLRAYGSNQTVLANTALLASSCAGQEWRLYRKPKQDGRQIYSTSDKGSDQRTEVLQHPALNLLANPNPHWSQFRLFEISQLWQELTGKWHWVVERMPGLDIPTGLWPVRPDRMTPVPDPETYLRGWLYRPPDGGREIALNPDEVIYEYLPDPMDLYGGTGPTKAVLNEIEGLRNAVEYNKNFFGNSARADGVIQVDHRLDEDEWDDLTSRWRESHRGTGNAHRVAVMEAGATWVPTGTTPKDMDFANLLSTGGDRVREAWGMHKIMTGLTEDVNRANAQTGEEVFAAWKVDPRLKRRRDTLNFQYLRLFKGVGDTVTWDYIYPMPRNREQDALEMTSKTSSVAALVGAGFEPGDVLAWAGLPPMRVAPKPPPSGLPPGTPGAGMPGQQPAIPGESGQGGDADNLLRTLRSRAGWDSGAWTALDEYMRHAAAWNRLAGARQ